MNRAQYSVAIMIKLKQICAALALSVLTALSYTPTVLATDANSTNYGVSEVNFGVGGELRACSTAYCAKQSAGETTVGSTSSTNYGAQAGFNTNREAFLEVDVTGGVIDLGILSESAVSSGSTTFSVKTYLASGYNVYIDGTSPKNKVNGHILDQMTTMTTSQPGVEQFGINLRDNSSPNVGTDVAQVPDNTFSFGAPATGYNTVNNFKYAAGDTIASSASSSSYSNFTLSMIANVATTTDGGEYGGRLFLNVIPTF